MTSRYFGILLGYLPYEGTFEFKTYSSGIVSGSFDDKLKQTLEADNRYYLPLIGQQCCFYINQDLKCLRIKSSEHFKFD